MKTRTTVHPIHVIVLQMVLALLPYQNFKMSLPIRSRNFNALRNCARPALNMSDLLNPLKDRFNMSALNVLCGQAGF